MLLRQIFDPSLSQYAYLLGCQQTGQALLIDPERDIDRYQEIAKANGLQIVAVTETHIHADFVSGSQEFAQDPEVAVYLSSEGGADWSYRWPKGAKNVHYLKGGDSFQVGNLHIEAIHTPGHTPEHLCFLVTDAGAGANEPFAIFTGDFIFAGDVGRPDLLESAVGVSGAMEPAAIELRESLATRLEKLGDYLLLLPAHGAGSSCGKSLGAVPSSTLGYERRFNAAMKLAKSDGKLFVKEILSGQPEPPPYFAVMKQVNRDGVRLPGSRSLPVHLSADEFKGLMLEKSMKVLDGRAERADFDDKHLFRSIHAPLYSPFFLTAAGSYLNIEDPVLLILEKSEDVEVATRQLYRIGFDRILGWTTVEEALQGNLFEARQEKIDFSVFDPSKARIEGEIVDVRSGQEHKNGHLEGALLIPYTQLKSQLTNIPKDKKLFVHCASGRRAAVAASFLSSEGFNVVHVDGAYRQ